MSYQATECFVIEVIGERQSVGVMWDGQCGTTSLHSARRRLGEVAPEGTLDPPDIHAPDWTDIVCDRCGTPAGGAELKRFGGVDRIWSTPDGTTNHPGAMYLTPDYGSRCFHWDNCPGEHLHVVLPNGHPWDVDSRANNCTRPEDRTHRCWVRSGDLPMVTAGKAGDTCSAGAGSILAGDYHGFLIDGVLTAG